MKKVVKCNHCKGTGKVIWQHIADGICFKCNGKGSYESEVIEQKDVITYVVFMADGSQEYFDTKEEMDEKHKVKWEWSYVNNYKYQDAMKRGTVAVNGEVKEIEMIAAYFAEKIQESIKSMEVMLDDENEDVVNMIKMMIEKKEGYLEMWKEKL